MVKSVLILGGGSAGFIAAITLKAKLPHLEVRLLRSKDIGIIGVGEGTTLAFPQHLHDVLGLDINEFYRLAEPQWKLGIRFIWGPRPWFDYGFSDQMDVQYRALRKLAGYYCEADSWEDVGVPTGLMSRNAVFLRGPDGRPQLRRDLAYHIENEKLVGGFLEGCARRLGVNIQDDTVLEVVHDNQRVSRLQLATGGAVEADLFVDSSGFYSVLLGKALNEPFRSFKGSLYCDRAVVGGWTRGNAEPIKPYTLAETMDAGWCWQIEHEFRINRGYVYSSSFISDDAAEAEFRRKNPKVEKTRIVRFITGRYERAWVGNVVGIGNSSGFVEPLEATSLGAICGQCQLLAESLMECDGEIQPALVDHFNRRNAKSWDTICQFLAIHYKFNTRLDTEFWRACREKVDLLGAADVVAYYREVGPSVLYRHTLLEQTDQFRMEGYLSLLVGQKVPYSDQYKPTPEELAQWEEVKSMIRRRVSTAVTVPEALRYIRSPDWRWPQDLYQYKPDRM